MGGGREGDGVALRSANEIERLPDVQGQVGIVDVLATGEFRYRLFGSGLWLTVALLGTFGREVFLSDGSPFFRSRD